MERSRPHGRAPEGRVTLPPAITPDGILQNLRRAKAGDGSAMAYHYRDFMREQGWIDERQNITREGMLELERRGVPA